MYSQQPYRSVFTKGVKYLIVINVAVYLLQQVNIFGDTNFYDILSNIFPNQNIPLDYRQVKIPRFELWFSLRYLAVTKLYFIWQPFTYMFLHSRGDFYHILFNMFGLFIFGRELEEYWGTKTFVKFYLFCGLGAGAFIFALDAIQAAMGSPPFAGTLGASGAIFGIMLTYALFYPERQIMLLFPPIPIKVKWFVIIYGGIQFVMLVSPGSGHISYAGHAGGMIAAFLFFRFNKRNGKYMIPNTTINLFFAYIKKLLFPNKGFKSRIFKTDREQHNLDPDDMTDYQIEMKIDDLLDKISLKGIISLSVKERQFLDAVATRFRHKFPD